MSFHARAALRASTLLIVSGCAANAAPPSSGEATVAAQEAPLEFQNNGVGAIAARVHGAAPVGPYGEYAGVFRRATGRSDVILGVDASAFLTHWKKNGARGLRLIDVGAHLDASGRRVFDGVYAEGNDAHDLLVGVDEETFLAKNTELTSAGLRLADVKIYLEDGQRRYVAAWRRGDGGHYLWLNADWGSFVDKWQSLAAANMRLVKLDVHEEDGQLKYTGYWREGSDPYYLWAGVSWNKLSQKWLELSKQGLRLVDLEAYTYGGQRLYAGVFRGGDDAADLLGSVDAAAMQRKIALEASAGEAPVQIEYDPGSQQPPPNFAAAFAALDDRVVGYSFAIADDGLLASTGAVGYARAPWESSQPGVAMTAGQRMTVASMSKPITNVALQKMLLTFGGSLDDPFYPYVASRLPNAAPGVEKVTLRNLLDHDSGMASWGCGPDFWAKMAELVQQPLVGTPGSTHQYANSNYCLVRAVIEARTNGSYGDWVQSQVLQRMGITDMSCAPDANEATRYYVEGQSSGDGIDFGDYTGECAAYGWYASAQDLAKFLRGVRTDVVLPHDVTRNQLLTTGWMSFTYSHGTFYGHNGGWFDGARHGFEGAYFTDPDGAIDAVLLVDTVAASEAAPDFDATTVLVDGFQAVP